MKQKKTDVVYTTFSLFVFYTGRNILLAVNSRCFTRCSNVMHTLTHSLTCIPSDTSKRISLESVIDTLMKGGLASIRGVLVATTQTVVNRVRERHDTNRVVQVYCNQFTA